MEYKEIESLLNAAGGGFLGNAPLANIDEIFLLIAFRAGSEVAFRELYERYNPAIRRAIAARIRDAEAVADLTQEVFLKLFRFRETYQLQLPFLPWMWTITRNTVFDHLRASSTEVQTDAGIEPGEIEQMPSHQEDSETRAVRRDQLRKLFRTARSLTRFQKRVLWLRLVHHLSFHEIAQRLGVSLAAVKNLSLRAKQSLADFS